MINIFTQLLEQLHKLPDLIYKKRCYFCKSSAQNSVMCDKCYENIETLPPQLLENNHGIKTYSAAKYESVVQKLIRGVKYHNQKELAFYQAKLMFDYWKTIENKEEKYTIIPVPLHKSREKKRKYNHMMLIAVEFAKLCGYEVNNDLIKRTKDTKPQYKLNIDQRKENLAGAFIIEKENYSDENLLVIDDIYTTGSTLNEITKELKKAGIEKITCFITSTTV